MSFVTPLAVPAAKPLRSTNPSSFFPAAAAGAEFDVAGAADEGRLPPGLFSVPLSSSEPVGVAGVKSLGEVMGSGSWLVEAVAIGRRKMEVKVGGRGRGSARWGGVGTAVGDAGTGEETLWTVKSGVRGRRGVEGAEEGRDGGMSRFSEATSTES